MGAMGLGAIQPGVMVDPPHPLATDYSVRELVFGPREATYRRLQEKFPELGQEVDYWLALQELSLQHEQRTYPEGGTEEGYAEAKEWLRKEVEAEVKKEYRDTQRNLWDPSKAVRQPFYPGSLLDTGPGLPFGGDIEGEVDRRLERKQIQGIHSPPLTDEQLEEGITSYMKAQVNQRVDKWRDDHPYFATLLETAGSVPGFLGVLHLVRKGMAKVGLGAATGAAGGAGQMITTEGLIQSAGVATGAREYDPYALGVSAISGAIGAKAANQYLRNRLAPVHKKLQSELPKWAGGKVGKKEAQEIIGQAFARAQKSAGGVDLLTDFSSDEFFMHMRRAVTGEEDTEDYIQKLMRGFVMFGAGRVGARALQATQKPGGLEAPKKRAGIEAKKGEVKAPEKKAEMPAGIEKGVRVRGTFKGKPVEGVVESKRTSKAGVERLGVRVGDEVLGLRADQVEVVPEAKAPSIERPTVTKAPAKPKPTRLESLLARTKAGDITPPEAREILAKAPKLTPSQAATVAKKAKVYTPKQLAQLEATNRPVPLTKLHPDTLSRLEAKGAPVLVKDAGKVVQGELSKVERGLGMALVKVGDQTLTRNLSEILTSPTQALRKAALPPPSVKAKMPGKTPAESEARRRAVESNVVASHTEVETAIRELKNARKRAAATPKQKKSLGEIETALRKTSSALSKTSDAKDAQTLQAKLRDAMKEAKKAWQLVPKGLRGGKERGAIPTIDLAPIAKRIRKAIVALFRAGSHMRQSFLDRPRGPKTRAISALHFAPHGMVSTGGPLSRAQMDAMRGKIEGGSLKVRKVRADDWKSVEIEFSDGTSIKLWDPDSTEAISELAREIAPPSARQDVKTRRAREDAAELAIVHYLHSGLAAQTREHFINLGDGLDAAFGLEGRPYLPRKFARLIGVELLDSVENVLFNGIDLAHRAEISRKRDEAKDIAFQAQKLLDFKGGEELSEMMWDNLTGGPRINPSEFPTVDMAKTYDMIRRIRDLYAWTGEVFYRNGMITEETRQRYLNSGEYSMRFYDQAGRVDTRALMATMYKDWLHQEGGPVAHRVLSPGSVIRALNTFLKKRKFTKEQAIAAGVDTSIARSIQGTMKQIETAAQLRLYERLRDSESGLVRKTVDDLPKTEVSRRAAEDRASKRVRRLTEEMTKRRIPLYLIEDGTTETREQRVSRGHAWQQYNKKRDRAIEDGLYDGPRDKLNKQQEARLTAVDRLADAAFGVTDFRRVPFVASAIKKPGLQPAFDVGDPVTVKWNRARTKALAAVKRLGDVAYRYKEIPDKPQYGAIRGMYVHRAVWDEIRQSASMATGLGALYEAVHMTGKKYLTAYNPATGLTNITGNLILNSMAGMQITHPDSIRLLAYCAKAFIAYRATGKLPESPDRRINLAIEEFRNTGMVEASQAAIELTKYSGGVRTALARTEAAIDDGRFLDAFGHWGQALVIGIDDAFLRISEGGAKLAGKGFRKIPGKTGQVAGKVAESLTLGKLQDRYYDSDTIQAAALYVSLRTGIGNVRTKGSSAEYAMAVTGSWYNYRQVFKPLRSVVGRGYGSFARFAWKSKTGVAMAMLTTPMMLPIVPQGAIAAAVGKFSPEAGKKIQGLSIKPTLGKSDTPEGQRAALVSSSTAIMGLKVAGALSGLALADYLGKLYSGMSDEEWEEGRTAATRNADPVKELWQLPTFMPTELPLFYDLSKAHPLAQMHRVWESDPYVKGGFGTKLIRDLAAQNILLSQLLQIGRGENYFGTTTDTAGQLWNISALMVPNILTRNIHEIYKQATGRTSKTGMQAFFQALGIKLSYGDPAEYDRTMRERFKHIGGVYRENVSLSVIDPTNTEARMVLRLATEYDRFKRAEFQMNEDRSR